MNELLLANKSIFTRILQSRVRNWELRGFDVLGLEAEAYEAGGELLEAGDGGEEL
jgi:hypothetical protein